MTEVPYWVFERELDKFRPDRFSHCNFPRFYILLSLFKFLPTNWECTRSSLDTIACATSSSKFLRRSQASLGINNYITSQVNNCIVADAFKFQKKMVIYSEQAPPPFLDRYECKNCIFYNPISSACLIVEGDIKPEAWCILWAPMRPPFLWLFE